MSRRTLNLNGISGGHSRKNPTSIHPNPTCRRKTKQYFPIFSSERESLSSKRTHSQSVPVHPSTDQGGTVTKSVHFDLLNDQGVTVTQSVPVNPSTDQGGTVTQSVSAIPSTDQGNTDCPSEQDKDGKTRATAIVESNFILAGKKGPCSDGFRRERSYSTEKNKMATKMLRRSSSLPNCFSPEKIHSMFIDDKTFIRQAEFAKPVAQFCMAPDVDNLWQSSTMAKNLSNYTCQSLTNANIDNMHQSSTNAVNLSNNMCQSSINADNESDVGRWDDSRIPSSAAQLCQDLEYFYSISSSSQGLQAKPRILISRIGSSRWETSLDTATEERRIQNYKKKQKRKYSGKLGVYLI